MGRPPSRNKRFPNGLHYLAIPHEEAVALREAGHERVLACLNGAHRWHAALRFFQDVGYVIYVGKTVRNAAGVNVGDVVHLTLTPDTSAYQFEMPEVLREVLALDPEADARFHTLTPGNQRSLMVLVTRVKSVDKQIERALKIASRLKQGIHAAQVILK